MENIEELQAEIKRQRELLANYRRLVGKLAVDTDKNRAWAIAKCWAPDELWRAIGFDLETEEAQQKFLFR
jgi:hypothetical protein